MKHPNGLPEQVTQNDRCLVMGVVNVTPDSFSDGGNWFDAEHAIARGKELLRQGADLLDIGGESTRPGSQGVPVAEELRRTIPVIRELAAAGAVISVDTMWAEVAQAAVHNGALIINDVSGALADPDMPEVAARARTHLGEPPAFVAMHWRGHAEVMDDLDSYDDVAKDVAAELAARVDKLLDAGIDRDFLVLDPGLGFSKSGDNNWPLLAHLDELAELDFPILVGASRKRFLGTLMAGPYGTPAPPAERDDATAAISALAADRGAWAVRVHEAGASVAAVRVANAWNEARSRLR